jgi:hypothetical protein
MATITYDEIHKLFNYNPETGIFTNKVFRGPKAEKKAVAGALNGDGYWQIQVNRKSYLAHRLAWLFFYGYFPEYGLDHRDRIRHHNWIDNLREATQSCNAKNCKIQSNNTSGITGVSWAKQAKKWMVCIQNEHHKVVCIGYFTSKLEAAQARYEAELKYGYIEQN